MTRAHIRFKREKVALCNICRTIQPLTWDHVPPTGAKSITPVEQHSVLTKLTATGDPEQYDISQNDVKYRTLCKKCNEMLGSRYDPALIKLTDAVGLCRKSELTLPRVIPVKTQPIAVAKSILGHFLAAKGHVDDVVMDQQMRPCVLDENLPVPDNLHVFYWLYPYNYVVTLRDIVMPAIRGRFNELGFFSVLKFFPLGYLVCDLPKYEGLSELTLFRKLATYENDTIDIDLKSLKHPQWPESTEGNNFMAGGMSIQSSVFAKERKKN